MSRSRDWIVVCNNYTEDHINRFKSFLGGGDKAVYGLEVGESGTPHIQGAIRLEHRISFKALSKKLIGFHLELMKGTPIQAFSYCLKGTSETKEGWTYDITGPNYNGWHYGKFPVSQGKRTDNERMKECSNMREAVQVAKNYQNIQFFKCFLEFSESPRKWKTEVYWYWGETGTGKSWLARKLAPNAYIKSTPNKWWNGYDGHEDVILNDYRHSWFIFSELLNLLDEYEHQVETKGGMRQFKPKRIFITTPERPVNTWFDHTGEDIKQLLRRLKGIYKFERKFKQKYIKIVDFLYWIKI